MRFISVCVSALSLLSGLVAAQQNPIIFPGTGAQLSAGQTYTITWKPTTTGTTISLALRYGPQRNLVSSSVIAVGVENVGTSTWVVPSGIGNGEWTIEIVDSAGNINYSPMFSVSGGTGTQGVAAVTSTVVAATATSTPTLTGLPVVSSGSVVTSTTSVAGNTRTTLSTMTTGTATGANTGTSTGTSTRATGSSPTGGAAQLASHGMAAIVGVGALVMLV